MNEDKETPNRFIPENCRYEKMWQQQVEAIKTFQAETRPLILSLLKEDFAAKPQVILESDRSVEALCSQMIELQ